MTRTVMASCPIRKRRGSPSDVSIRRVDGGDASSSVTPADRHAEHASSRPANPGESANASRRSIRNTRTSFPRQWSTALASSGAVGPQSSPRT